MSLNFARYGFGWMDATNGATDYPPTFFAIQGAWIKLGAALFNFDLGDSALNNIRNLATYPNGLVLWGVILELAILLELIAIMYLVLKNKWLLLSASVPSVSLASSWDR